ncbi:hypothetical protein GCM10007938_25130 [Vibrio zhanjiangensis]|uniref:Uncharacterized protein n=1 Tax=Vibrio zhanjiangensis TaxID=1046128 RepID=A0ABQ6F1Y1_9VIBR|nr:hypothetical protein GCM10007938_25130 [Vibrio zhanjiangensis]
MIFIRTEGGIEKHADWEVVASRVSYQTEHTPDDAELVEIIGYYELEKSKDVVSVAATQHITSGPICRFTLSTQSTFERHIHHECYRGSTSPVP